MSLRVIDTTSLRRLKGLLNLARWAGTFLTGVSLFLAALMDWRLFFPSALLFWASVRVWRENVTASAVLAALTLWAAVRLLHDYLKIAARVLDPSIAEKLAATTREWNKYNLYFAIAFLAFFALFLMSLVAAIALRKALPAPSDPRSPMARLEHCLTKLWLRLTPRVVLWSVLVAAFAVAGTAPLLILLLEWRSFPDKSFLFEGGTPTWLYWGIMAWSFVFLVLTHMAVTKTKRWAALSVAKARSFDARSPVLLLRSFRDDMTPLIRSREWQEFFTLEEAAERELSFYGPVIAIGRPGEALPPPGVAREYVSNEAWQRRIKEFIAEARLIVVILGSGEGLEFEYRALAELQALPKVIVVFPPFDKKARSAHWVRFAACVLDDGEVVSQATLGRALTALIDPDGPIFVTCRSSADEDTYRLALRRSLAILSSKEKAAA